MAVESMFSYAFLHRFHAQTSLLIEPSSPHSMLSLSQYPEDWWSHQYVAQTNQPWSGT